MSLAAIPYRPQSGAGRAAALSAIFAFHAVAIAGFVSLGGVQMVMRQAEPLLVRIVPEPPPRPVETPRAVPLPSMRPPEVRIPMPPIENLFTIRVDETAPPSAPIAQATPVPSAPASVDVPAPVVEPPRADMAYLNNPAPAYPTVSKRAGEQGRVMVRVRVDAAGMVEAVELQATSGFPRLDEAALAAVRRWKFMPAKLGSRSVAGWAIVPIHFTLRG